MVLLCAYVVTQKEKVMGEATFTFRVEEGLKAEFAEAVSSNNRNFFTQQASLLAAP